MTTEPTLPNGAPPRHYGLIDIEVDLYGHMITYYGFVAEGCTFRPHAALPELYVGRGGNLMPVVWRMHLRGRRPELPPVEVVQTPDGAFWPVGAPHGAALPVGTLRLALASRRPGLLH